MPFLKDLFRYCWLKRPQEKRSTLTMRHSPLLEHLWSLSVFGLPWRVIGASVSLDSVGQAKRQSDQSIEALQTQVRPYLGKLHSPSWHFVLACSIQPTTHNKARQARNSEPSNNINIHQDVYKLKSQFVQSAMCFIE